MISTTRHIAARLALLSRHLPLLFVLATAPVLVMFAFTTPTGEVPDEVAHIVRADSVRLGQLSGFRRLRTDPQFAGRMDVVVRGDFHLFEAGFELSGRSLAEKQLTRARLQELLDKQWSKPLAEISVVNTGVYPPFLYAPAALGLQVTKWLGRGPFTAIIVARLANVLAYLVIGSVAIRLAERGQTALFALLCLPMSLFLAASVNQDSIAIACAALAGALLTRRTRRSWWAGVGVLSLVCMAKPYLLPLALIVPATMPPASILRTGARDGLTAWAGLVAATAPAVLWGLAMARFVAAPFIRGAQPAGPLWTGAPGTIFDSTDAGEQLRILLAVPSRLLSLPLTAMWDQGTVHWHAFIGTLGLLDIHLSNDFYRIWGWVLLASLLAGFVGARRPLEQAPVLPALTALYGAILSVWLVYILQFLSWTRVGEAVIEGVQGRYFIPIAAIAVPVATLPLLRLSAGPVVRTALTLPVVALATGGVALLPLLTLAAYYVR